MNERYGPLLVLATACRDAAHSQITLDRLVHLFTVYNQAKTKVPTTEAKVGTYGYNITA